MALAQRVKISELTDGSTLIQINSPLFQNSNGSSFAGSQRRSNWCWAACLELLLRYHGVDESQESLVYRAFGETCDRPGRLIDLKKSVPRQTKQGPDGHSVSIDFSTVSLSEAVILRNLRNAQPLLLGVQGSGQYVGHDVLITGAVYKANKQGQRESILRLKLVDPAVEPGDRLKFMDWDQALQSYNRIGVLNFAMIDPL